MCAIFLSLGMLNFADMSQFLLWTLSFFVCYHFSRSNPNLSRYLDAVSQADVSGLDRASTYSFFINVYNAFAINMVIKNPCKKSLLRQVHSTEPSSEPGHMSVLQREREIGGREREGRERGKEKEEGKECVCCLTVNGWSFSLLLLTCWEPTWTSSILSVVFTLPRWFLPTLHVCSRVNGTYHPPPPPLMTHLTEATLNEWAIC